jgi:hypothetical protein
MTRCKHALKSLDEFYEIVDEAIAHDLAIKRSAICQSGKIAFARP